MLRFLLRRPPLLLRFLSTATPFSAKPALVLGTLRRHGVPDELCSSVVARFPRILALKAEILAPKLAFLRSEGFSGPEVARILLHKPYILLRSLRWSLAPSLARLKLFLPHSPRDEVLDHIMRGNWTGGTGRMNYNIYLLRDRGVPEVMIKKLADSHWGSMDSQPWDFIHRVDFIDKLNIRPTAAAFTTALRALHGMSRSTIQKKVKLYKKLGWAEEEVFRVFRLQPTVVRLSDGVVRRKLAYFRDALGWDPDFLCRYPEIMKMSVEKRIAPRCAVLDMLMSRGLLGRTTRPACQLKVSNARFVEELVEKTAPDVARAYYAGQAEFGGWSWLKEDAKNQPLKKLASS